MRKIKLTSLWPESACGRMLQTALLSHYVCRERGCGQKTNEDTQLWNCYMLEKMDKKMVCELRKLSGGYSFRLATHILLALIAKQEDIICGLNINKLLPLKDVFFRNVITINWLLLFLILSPLPSFHPFILHFLQVTPFWVAITVIQQAINIAAKNNAKLIYCLYRAAWWFLHSLAVIRISGLENG